MRLKRIKDCKSTAYGRKGSAIMDNNKRLYRSSTNYMLCGVCGGIAEYFNIDPTLVRIAWVVLSVFNVGWGIVAYILAAIIIPK
jgi:phage shock protein C